MTKDDLNSATPDGDTENRILEAAQEVFIRRGTAGARMQEIAKEAGVNQALLHYYFRTKERLSEAIFLQIAKRIFPRLAGILGSDSPLDEKIEQVVNTYLTNLSRAPYLPGYLLSELHHHPERIPKLLESVTGAPPGEMLSPILVTLKAQIDAEVAAGRMRPIEPEQFAVNLISLCIFPFAARPMLRVIFGMDDAAFEKFIERRKTDLPVFFRAALRP